MRVRELRDVLGKRVDAAHYGGEFTLVTTNGEKRAVLVPHAWFLEVTRQQGDSPAP